MDARRFQQRVLLLVVWLAALCSHAARIAAPLPLDVQFVGNPHFDILVVTVLEFDQSNAAGHKLTTATLRVEETLRGTTGRQQFRAVFDQRPGMSDSVFGDVGVGEKLIVFTALPGASPVTIPVAYAFSDDTKQVILRGMAPPERAWGIQVLLFLAVVALPIVSLVILLVCRAVKMPAGRHVGLRVLAIALCTITFPVYAYYESGISVHTNIRVDLLPLYLALLGNLAVLISGIVALFRKSRRPLTSPRISTSDQ